jgi:hypothetical protein
MAFSDLMHAVDTTIRNTFAEASLTFTHKASRLVETVQGIVLDPPQLEEAVPVSVLGTTQLWVWAMYSDFQLPPETGDTVTVVGTYNGVDVGGSYVVSKVAVDSVGGCEAFLRRQG